MAKTILIGRVQGAHGVQGELKVQPLCDDPHRFSDLEEVILTKGNRQMTHAIDQVRYHKGSVLLVLADVEDRTAAELLKGYECHIPLALRRPLPPDRFYIEDLIGLDVYQGDEHLGQVKEILQPGANDVYVVKRAEEVIYVPALKEVVRQVDLAAGRMDVDLPKGLRE